MYPVLAYLPSQKEVHGPVQDARALGGRQRTRHHVRWTLHRLVGDVRQWPDARVVVVGRVIARGQRMLWLLLLLVAHEAAVLQVVALVQLQHGGVFAPRHTDHEEVVEDLLVVVEGAVALEATREAQVHPVAAVLRVHLVDEGAALREVRQDHAGGRLGEPEHGHPTVGGHGVGNTAAGACRLMLPTIHRSTCSPRKGRRGKVVFRSRNDALPALRSARVVQRVVECLLLYGGRVRGRDVSGFVVDSRGMRRSLTELAVVTGGQRVEQALGGRPSRHTRVQVLRTAPVMVEMVVVVLLLVRKHTSGDRGRQRISVVERTGPVQRVLGRVGRLAKG